jgi:8-oxo-dGTP pyrophosphatase MutT (NUDIX family)
LEETGIRGRPTAFLGIWMDVYGDASNEIGSLSTANCCYLFELVSAVADTDLDTSEVLALRWFELQNLPANFAFPGHVPEALAAAVAVAQSH